MVVGKSKHLKYIDIWTTYISQTHKINPHEYKYHMLGWLKETKLQKYNLSFRFWQKLKMC